MKRQYFLAAAVITGTMALTTSAVAKDRETGRGTGPVVCVGSRGLFNDSIVLADLPAHGWFQLLEPGVGSLRGLATDSAGRVSTQRHVINR